MLFFIKLPAGIVRNPKRKTFYYLKLKVQCSKENNCFELSALSYRIFGLNGCVMAKIEIDKERCKGCGLCMASCPKNLIRVGEEINRQGYFFMVWDGNEACTGCALCGEICPDVAIRVWR